MKKKQNWHIKIATDRDDQIITQHFYQLWLDNNFSADLIKEDWQQITLDFIKKAREELSFRAWLVEIDGKIVASVACQFFYGLYPSVFKAGTRQFGYIWNVYVESDYRRQGIATALVNQCLEYLKSIGCTKVLLHASNSGKPVYEKLDFLPSNEMFIDIVNE